MIKWKYCPQCKSKLDLSGEYPHCNSCNLTIYLDSKPTASVLIVKGKKVLLAKRGIEPFKGEYDIVGGFLKYGEDPIAGVLREAEEEAGLKIKIIDLLGIYVDTYGKGGDYTLNINYVGEIISGEIRPADDVSDLVWHDIDKLPKPAFKNQESAFRDLKKWFLSRGAEN